MMNTEACAFCNRDGIGWRTIRSHELFISFVSKPWFRPGQTLVIPRRHMESPGELRKDEAGEMLMELGRLSVLLDEGYGVGMMQKYQPLQAENGIKMNHLHFHVFPRHETEPGLFPVPEPNAFDGFITPSDEEVTVWVDKLRSADS